MTASLLFLALLGLTTLTRLWLGQRQIGAVTRHRDHVPADFRDVISLEAHRKAADYTTAKLRVGHWEILWDALLLLGWTLGGGLQWLIDLVARFDLSPLTGGVVLILLFGAISALLDAPFALYRRFVVEARFGFNRMTLRTLIADTIKGTIVTIVLAAPLLYLLLWLLEAAGNLWWLYGWAAFFGFGIFMGWAWPTLIAPLFNRFTPLDDAELKQAIEQLLETSGFTASGIYVMDGSRRSSHGNAYFTGLGKSKRIVFFDTLLERLNKEEVLAVLAHELGHFKHHHIRKGLILNGLTSLIGFALLAWLLPQPGFYHALGVTTPTPAAGLILFSLVVPLATFFIDPLLAWLSRRHEFEADRYAARHASTEALISALVTLYRDNASTLTPDRLYSLFYDSHPAAAIRIAALRQQRPEALGGNNPMATAQ